MTPLLSQNSEWTNKFRVDNRYIRLTIWRSMLQEAGLFVHTETDTGHSRVDSEGEGA
jgi:hypothetical protein